MREPLNLNDDFVLWSLAEDLIAHHMDMLSEDHEYDLNQHTPNWKEVCLNKIFKNLIDSMIFKQFGERLGGPLHITKKMLVVGVKEQLREVCEIPSKYGKYLPTEDGLPRKSNITKIFPDLK